MLSAYNIAMLSIEFNLEERTETVLWLNQELFTAPLCYCLNECASGRPCDLLERVNKKIDDVFPPEPAGSDWLSEYLNKMFPDSEPVSLSSLADCRPNYRFKDSGACLAFCNLLKTYAERCSTDALCRSLVFFHFVFGEDVISSVGKFMNGNHTPHTYVGDEDDEGWFSAFDFDVLRGEFAAKYSENASLYNLNYIEDLGTATLYCLIRHNLTPYICQNCGRIFVPRHRSDEIYCEFSSPQEEGKTCKEYGSRHLWYDRQSQDPALKLWRNIYTAKQMLVRRNPDIKAYADNFDRFKSESAEWKRKYKSGECTADEFISWLNEQKGKKT